MAMYTDDEALNGLTEILEDLESDESDESDEARRPFRPRVPSGRGLYKQRPTSKYVTQVQLQAALARVGQQIKTNATATKAVSARVDKEATARKKETADLRKDMKKAREMAIFPLLLQKAPELDVKRNADQVVTDVSVKKSSDNLLPLILLMGGLGGSGEGKDDDNSMMLLAVMMMNR